MLLPICNVVSGSGLQNSDRYIVSIFFNGLVFYFTKMSKTIDVLQGCKTLELKCLDQGFVRLHEVSPRLVSEGRTLELAIVENARISYGSHALRTLKEDTALVNYLVQHSHTSPLEVVRFTFHLKCPLFVAVHFLRHRTASINQVSHRYTPGKRGDMYKPSSDPLYSIRKQDVKNRQASVQDQELSVKALEKIQETEQLLEKVFGCYEELLELGVARESARFCLPQGIYTQLFFTIDLNNFLKMVKLRTAPGAQLETQIYATAMLDLVKPLIPIAWSAFQNYHMDILTLTRSELRAVQANQPQLPVEETASKRAQEEYVTKRRLLFGSA